jgi:hypothetical protein
MKAKWKLMKAKWKLITPLHRSKHQALTQEKDGLIEKIKQQEMQRKKWKNNTPHA